MMRAGGQHPHGRSPGATVLSAERRPALLRLIAGGAALLGLVSLGLAGCASASTASGDGPVVALLLPESKTARYEDVDGPVFADIVEERCPDCHVLRANADQDAARQQEQAESVLAQGADVLVIDAVDSVAAASIVAAASERGVPVIAYDRFLAGASYYVSFDSELVGRMQGKVLVDALNTRSAFSDTRLAGVLVVNGATTDPNSAGYKRGLMSVLQDYPVEILAQYDTPDWSPDKAQSWVEAQLTIYGSKVDGVYAANDGTAAGAISALRAAGRDPVPPVTGQDAELAAIQRIVDGDQTMTVFKAIPAQARTAAELAVRVVRGETPATTSVVDGIPSLLLNPVVITKADIKRVIIDGGVYTADQICQQPYTRACNDAGLIPAGGS